MRRRREREQVGDDGRVRDVPEHLDLADEADPRAVVHVGQLPVRQLDRDEPASLSFPVSSPPLHAIPPLLPELIPTRTFPVPIAQIHAPPLPHTPLVAQHRRNAVVQRRLDPLHRRLPPPPPDAARPTAWRGAARAWAGHLHVAPREPHRAERALAERAHERHVRLALEVGDDRAGLDLDVRLRRPGDVVVVVVAGLVTVRRVGRRSGCGELRRCRRRGERNRRELRVRRREGREHRSGLGGHRRGLPRQRRRHDAA
jgi:hypothetical protein